MRRWSHLLDCCRLNVGRTLTLVVTLLLFSIGVSPLSLEDVSSIRHSEDQIQSAPLVTWNVGDSWLYDIELDAIQLGMALHLLLWYRLLRHLSA